MCDVLISNALKDQTVHGAIMRRINHVALLVILGVISVACVWELLVVEPHSMDEAIPKAVKYQATDQINRVEHQRTPTAPALVSGNERIDIDKRISDKANDKLQQLLTLVARNGVVTMTTTDSGYIDMTSNWICHIKKLGIEKEVIVFALDKEIHEFVQSKGIASYFDEGMSKTSIKIGYHNSKSYNQVVHTKTKHQKTVLERGFDLFFTDVDIPWTSDFRPPVIHEANGVDFIGQQNWPQNDMNTGFFYMKT